MTTYEGTFTTNEETKIAIVAGRFNELITSKLLEGAKDNLLRHGIKESNIDIYWVPGAFEIPYLTNQLLKKKQYDGILTLGAVIRGATTHYDLVSNEVAKGVSSLALQSEIPISFGVLTTETIEQAIERAGTKAGNKGSEVAQGLLEMISLTEKI
jgi:6,7-dimethyl-8-ribityllumazine synthase